MTSMYAECPEHGLFDVPGFFHVTPGAGVVVNFRGNSVSCPQCERMSPMLEGKFLVTDTLLEIIQASDLTREKLTRVTALLQRAQEFAATNPQAAAAAVAEVSPALAKRLWSGYGSGQAQTTVGVIGAILTLIAILQVHFDDHSEGVTPAQLQELIETVQHGEAPLTQTPPAPRKPGQPGPGRTHQTGDSFRRQPRSHP